MAFAATSCRKAFHMCSDDALKTEPTIGTRWTCGGGNGAGAGAGAGGENQQRTEQKYLIFMKASTKNNMIM